MARNHADDSGLSGFLRGLGSLIDLVSSMDGIQDRIERSGELKGPGGARAVYGFSVKMGLPGSPVVERFGNVRDTRDGPVVDDVREPYADVLDEGNEILVVVEMPGVEPDAVRVEVRGDVLEVSGESGRVRYSREVLLPARADPTPVRFECRNGLVEIRLARVGGEDNR